MIVEVGNVLKNRFTGELYKVKKVRKDRVTLESVYIPNKGWFGEIESLDLLYEKIDYEWNEAITIKMNKSGVA